MCRDTKTDPCDGHLVMLPLSSRGAHSGRANGDRDAFSLLRTVAVFALVCFLVALLSREAGRGLPYSWTYQHPTVAQLDAEVEVLLKRAEAWGATTELPLSRTVGKKFMCVLLQSGRQPNVYVQEAMRSLFEGLSHEEAEQLHTVALVKGPKVPFERVIRQFHQVVIEDPNHDNITDRFARIRRAHSDGLELCRGKCDVILALEDDVRSSRHIVDAIRNVVIEAERAARAADKTWVCVKLFYSDYWDGWATETTPQFLFVSISGCFAFIALAFYVVPSAKHRVLITLLVAVFLFVLLFLSFTLGRQAVFRGFRPGLNLYRGSLAQALLYNNKDGLLDGLITHLRDAAHGENYDLEIDRWVGANENRLAAYVWGPCLFQHTGAKTSMGEDRDLNEWIPHYKKCSVWKE